MPSAGSPVACIVIRVTIDPEVPAENIVSIVPVPSLFVLAVETEPTASFGVDANAGDVAIIILSRYMWLLSTSLINHYPHH